MFFSKFEGDSGTTIEQVNFQYMLKILMRQWVVGLKTTVNVFSGYSRVN